MKLTYRNFIETEQGAVALKDMDAEALKKWREKARDRMEEALNLYYCQNGEEYRQIADLAIE